MLLLAPLICDAGANVLPKPDPPGPSSAAGSGWLKGSSIAAAYSYVR